MHEMYIIYINIYDGKIGNFAEMSEEHDDVRVVFLHPHGPAQLIHWPSRSDECWVPCFVHHSSTCCYNGKKLWNFGIYGKEN